MTNNNNSSYGLTLLIGLSVIAFFAMFGYALAISMSEETKRILGVLIVITPICGFFVLFGIWFFKPKTANNPQNTQIIDHNDSDSYRRESNPRQLDLPLQRYLPPPQTHYVPFRHDLLYQNQRIPPPDIPISNKIVARVGNENIEVCRSSWQALTECDVISRDEWRKQLSALGATAPNSDYSKCSKIAIAYSAITGNHWISDEARDQVTSWLMTSTPPQS